jgi:AraC family transcriptional regulator
VNIEPKVVTISEKKLLGMRIRNSIAQDKTSDLWQSFMPRRKEIANAVGSDLYSLRIYDSPSYFTNFSPSAAFDKWALAEVADFDRVPSGMETLVLPGGLYAVFPYKGLPSAAGETYRHIYATWLPSSQYILDDRPHFEILGEKYKNNDPSSEEDIYIPIKPKA